MKSALILLNGGSGSRFSSKVPKQYSVLSNDNTIFEQTLYEIIEDNKDFHQIVIPTQVDQIDRVKDLVSDIDENIVVIKGGSDRLGSIKNAYEELDPIVDNIIIHDVVRPIFGKNIFDTVIQELNNSSRVAVYTDNTSQQYFFDNGNVIPLEKNNVFVSCLPQGYKKEELEDIFSDSNFVVDLPNGFLKQGKEVKWIKTNAPDFKLTYPEDIFIIEAFINKTK